MLGWSGVCYQFYQIQNSQYQWDMIKMDGYTKVQGDKDSQLFIYSFPREDCIRLDELLKSISSDYVKIYGAQALRLIWDIIDHHHIILESKRFHGNLTSRNVWIVFDQWNQKTRGGERFRCKFSKLKYKIHFTGYQQNPLNGNYNIENECSQVAEDILNVLEYCQTEDHKNRQSKKEMNLEKMKSMLLPYAQEQQKLFEQIKQIFQQYPYNQEEQRFKDLDCEQYALTERRNGNIQTQAEYPIKTLFQQQPMEQNTLKDKLKWRMQTIMQEIQFWEYLPKIVESIYKNLNNFDLKKEEKQIEPSINCLIQRINDLKSKFYGQMLIEFQENLDKKLQEQFKMEIKLYPEETEPQFMYLFRTEIAESLNDLHSFRNLNENWLKNEEQFEARIFEKHKPYLMEKHEEKIYQEAKDLVRRLK